MCILLFAFLLGCTGTIYNPSVTAGTGTRNFSPEPGVEMSTRKALVRWVKASGIRLNVSETGMPIYTQEEWVYVEGKSNCGNTDFILNEITVSTKREKCSYFSFDDLIAHEVGHAIAGVGGHSDTGIMAPGGKADNRDCIDLASLEVVCRTADCEVFEPECY